MHIAPGQGANSPQGTKFWCQQNLLVTLVICCKFQITDNNSFWKIHCFTFFQYKSIRDQSWPSCKIGQGQPRVIKWVNLVILEHPMMHTKIQGHQPFCSGADFFRFLSYMGMAAILVMLPGPFEQTFVPLSHRSSYEIWLWLAQWFLKSKECRRWWMKTGGLPSSPICSPIWWAKNPLRYLFPIQKHKGPNLTLP